MIYIANTTRQVWQLHVRMPEMGRVYVRNISSGKQDEVKDLSPSQEEAMIEHMQLYGAKSRLSLYGKIQGFSGLAFSTDKPFNMDEFHYGHEDVLNSAENRSVTEAVKSALAADILMRDGNGDRLSQSSEIEMAEDRPEKGKNAKKMSIKIDPEVGSSDKLPMH